MRKHLKLASSLGVLSALVTLSAHPAHADWRKSGFSNPLPLDVSVRDTIAKIEATGAGTTPNPDRASVNHATNYQFYWDDENDAATPPSPRYEAIRLFSISGSLTPHLDAGATGPGQSITTFQLNNKAAVVSRVWSDQGGTIHTEDVKGLGNSDFESGVYTWYRDPFDNLPILNVSSPINVTASSEERSLAETDNVQDFPGPRGLDPDDENPGGTPGGTPAGPGNQRNLAPGTAKTTGIKVTLKSFGFAVAP